MWQHTEKLGCGSSSSLVNFLLKFQVTNLVAEYGFAEDETELLAESSPDPWTLPVFMNVVAKLAFALQHESPKDLNGF